MYLDIILIANGRRLQD